MSEEIENRKITMHLEATDGLQNDDATDYFISGPLLIFAEVDNLDDLYGDELEAAILNSTFYAEKQTIIVFVKNLFCSKKSGLFRKPDPIGNLKYRGSYFMYDYSQEVVIEDKSPAFYETTTEKTYVNTAWQEILVGTHTHDNKIFLDKLSQMDVNDNKGFIEVIQTENGYDFILREIDAKIPELPKYIRNAIEDNAKVLDYPTDSEYNHLDGTALYNIDSPEALAQCSDLYEYVRTLGKKLYVCKNAEGVLYLSSNRDTDCVRIDAYDAPIDGPRGEFQGKTYYSFIGVNNFNVNPDVLVFIDNHVVSDLEYVVKISKEHQNILNVIFDPEVDLKDKTTITVIVLGSDSSGNISRKDVYDAISANQITLADIKSEIFEIYINADLRGKKEVPKVYLTNDDEGNLIWDNRILPTQSFYCKHKYLFSTSYRKSAGYYTFEFEDVNFDYKYDFPLIMVDEVFAFNAEYFTSGSKKQNLTLRIPGDYFKDSEQERITLIVIKNTGGNAISQEMLRNYVTKEDAVKILSNGKISLDDFVQFSDLDNYAFKAHTHSNFALLDHTHDYRYADYKHTHAEYITSYGLLQILNKIYPESALSDSDIVEMSEDLTAYEDLVVQINETLANKGFIKKCDIDNILRDAGFEYSCNERKFYQKSDTVYLNTSGVSNKLLEKLLYENETLDNIKSLNFTDLTARILNIFENDTVEDDHVLLSDDILVYNPVGGIKEFDDKGYRTVIKKGTDYHTILNNILNPYISKENIEDMITPVRAEFKFYEDASLLHEIDPEFVDYENEEIVVYAKFIRYLNKFGQDCEYIYHIENTQNKIKIELDPKVIPTIRINPVNGSDADIIESSSPFVEVKDSNQNFIGYATKFNITPNTEILFNISITTKSANVQMPVYDNREHEVLSNFQGLYVDSNEYFFNFERCLARYTVVECIPIEYPDILNNKPGVYEYKVIEEKEFNDDILLTIPASKNIQSIYIAYQDRVREKFTVMYGQTSILSSFATYDGDIINSVSGENIIYRGDVNKTEYEVIKYDLLPLDTDTDLIIYLDKNNILCKYISGEGKGSGGNIDSEELVGIKNEITGIKNEIDTVKKTLAHGVVQISDISVNDESSFVMGTSYYPQGYFFINKDIDVGNIAIDLKYYDGSVSNLFQVSKDPDGNTTINISGKSITRYRYRYEMSSDATPVNFDAEIRVAVSNAISDSIEKKAIKFKPIIKHGIYAPALDSSVTLTNENVYAGTYNYDFFVKSEYAGEGCYIMLAVPTAVADNVKFEVNSFAGGFEKEENAVILENVFGQYCENWTIFKSTQENLGEVLIHVYTIGVGEKYTYQLAQKIENPTSC